jgi:hypothetical protein
MTTHALTKRRRWAIAGLLTLAIITGFLAVMATWLNRQALNTDNWTNTSTKLLANQKIRDAVGAYLVNELFTNVDVAGELRGALPKQAQPLAAPVAGALRELATRAAPELLARPRVQDAWEQANRTAHKELIALLEGGGKNVQTTNGDVVLNLRGIVNDLASTLGIQSQVNAARAKAQTTQGQAVTNAASQRLGIKLPPDTGQLVLLHSDSIQTAQDTAQAVRGLSYLMIALTFVLWAVAVAIAPGMRRIVLRRIGWSFIGIALAILLLRRVGGHAVADGLAQVDSAKGVILETWFIGSSLLYTIAVTVLIYGVLIVIAAWLAGETRSASAVRWALAPTMRERPAIAYVVLAGVYLLVLVWGPTPAFRNWLPALLIAGLLVLGLEMLRRQCVREFPTAQPGDARRAMRTWSSEHLTPGGRANAAEARSSGSKIDDLERLSALHARGDLTDEEFAVQKGLLIGSV